MSGGDWKELFAAACEGDIELVRYHAKNGVDLDYAHPEFLSTPLVACILAQQAPAAHLLLDEGANPLLHSEFDGLTPVQAARQAGLADVEARLRSLGAPEPVDLHRPWKTGWGQAIWDRMPWRTIPRRWL
jgi:ankyrin repeat protein